MKLRFLGLAAFIILLCFPAGKGYSYFDFPAKVEHSIVSSSNGSSIVKVDQWTLFTPATSLERIGTSARSVSHSESFKQFVNLPGTTDDLYESLYTQYTFLFKNLPIPNREGKLIYPFHYFW